MDIKYILFRGSEINLSQEKYHIQCTHYLLLTMKLSMQSNYYQMFFYLFFFDFTQTSNILGLGRCHVI